MIETVHNGENGGTGKVRAAALSNYNNMKEDSGTALVIGNFYLQETPHYWRESGSSLTPAL